jgi:hypothetical protein
MLVPRPLTGDRIQSTNDAGSLASQSLDGISQLRDESLGVGQSSSSFLQLVHDTSQGSVTNKNAKVFDNIGSPYGDIKRSSLDKVNENGLTDNFANVSVRRVTGLSSASGADTGTPDNKTTATVYGDGSLDVGMTGGNSVSVDAPSGQIALNSEGGTFTSDGVGNYYFTGKDGRRKLIDQETARELGVELKAGSLTVGKNRFDRNGLSLADGSSISASQGRVHAHFKDGDGPKGNVEIETSSGQSVVTSDSGAQSLVCGNDAFISDGHGGMHYTKLAGNQLDYAEAVGRVPIREAMMTLFGLADGVRGKSVITPEQYSALQAAVADLNGASIACKDLNNVEELRFINGVSTAVNRFLSHVGAVRDPNSQMPTAQTELTESIAEPFSRSENRELPGSPSYLPPMRFDVSDGVWAEQHSNEPPVSKTRTDNPGMVSDAAISEASKVLPSEKA